MMSAKILKSNENGLIEYDGWNKDQNARSGDSGSALQSENFSGANMIIAIHISGKNADIGIKSFAVNVTTHQKWIEDIALTEF